jgi:hypothetical protein
MRRRLVTMIGVAAALVMLLAVGSGSASSAPPAPTCDPAGTWDGAFSSTSTDPVIHAADNGTVRFTIQSSLPRRDDRDRDDRGRHGGPIFFTWKTDQVLPSMASVRGVGVLRPDMTFTILGAGTISTAPPGYDRFGLRADGTVDSCNGGHANTASNTTAHLVFANGKTDTVAIPFLFNETFPGPGGGT